MLRTMECTKAKREAESVFELKLPVGLKQHAVFVAYKLVTSNRAALRLPNDALRGLQAEAGKMEAGVTTRVPVDIDALLAPLGWGGGARDVHSQAEALYIDEDEGLSVGASAGVCPLYRPRLKDRGGWR